MSARVQKIPDEAHPIRIEPHPSRVKVRVAGRTIADSKNALSLQEAHYPAVLYIPRADVDMQALAPTEHVTYCPYKGECRYFSVPSGGERAVNAVWSYPHPYAAVAPIKEHLAFYPDRVDSIEID